MNDWNESNIFTESLVATLGFLSVLAYPISVMLSGTDANFDFLTWLFSSAALLFFIYLLREQEKTKNKVHLARIAYEEYLKVHFRHQVSIVLTDAVNRRKVFDNQVILLKTETEILMNLAKISNISPKVIQERIDKLIYNLELEKFSGTYSVLKITVINDHCADVLVTPH